MRFPMLVVFLLSGATVVSSETAEREERYPSFPSPDGVEFYDFEHESATHTRAYGWELPEGLTTSDVVERCGLAVARGFTTYGHCTSKYIVNECWIVPNQQQPKLRDKMIYTAEEVGPYALEWICLDPHS